MPRAVAVMGTDNIRMREPLGSLGPSSQASDWETEAHGQQRGLSKVATETISPVSQPSGQDTFPLNHSVIHSLIFFQQVMIEPTICEALGQGWGHRGDCELGAHALVGRRLIGKQGHR